jgi:hypothetical protein
MGLKPLRSAVETWAPGRGIAADPLHRIAAAWRDIVGANVAAHSEPIELSGSTLLVATRSSAWSQQLQMLSPTILDAVRALPQAVDVRRLAFRSGGLRRAGRRAGIAARRAEASVRRPLQPPFEPAADAAEALARLRLRIATARRASVHACAGCGAATAEGADRCAPCAGEAVRDRLLAIQRLVYVTPWLGHADLREHMPDLSGAEFETVRRTLLQRWWIVLERAKRAGTLGRSGIERQLAGSYVLLASRLPPARITPAVVANLLGDELVRLLWPATAKPEPGRKAPFVE